MLTILDIIWEDGRAYRDNEWNEIWIVNGKFLESLKYDKDITEIYSISTICKLKFTEVLMVQPPRTC